MTAGIGPVLYLTASLGASTYKNQRLPSLFLISSSTVAVWEPKEPLRAAKIICLQSKQDTEKTINTEK